MSEGKAARKLGFIFFHVFNPRIPPRSYLWAYESQEKIPRWKLKTFDTSMPKALCQTRSRAGNLPYRDVDARGNFVGRREEEPRFIMLDDDLWWFKAKVKGVKGVKGQKSKCLKALWKVPYQQRLELIVRWVDWVPGRCIKSCDISDISIKEFRQKFRRTGNTCQNQRNKRWQKTGNIETSHQIIYHLKTIPSYPIRFFNLSPPSLVKSSSAPSVVSAPCLESRRSCLFFSCERQWKASRFSTCEMWRKCDILCFFFCLVLIRFLYLVNSILTEFCLTRRGTATALAPACRCPSCPSCPAVDAVGGERAAAEHGAFGAFEYGAECGTQSELLWRFFKVFLFQNLGREWYLN